MLLHFKRFHPEKQETRQSIIMIYDYVRFLSKENKNTIGTVKEGVFLSKKVRIQRIRKLLSLTSSIYMKTRFFFFETLFLKVLLYTMGTMQTFC
jgi:hypothetical protein